MVMPVRAKRGKKGSRHPPPQEGPRNSSSARTRGLAFGVGVFAVMSFAVIPLSRIPASTPPLPLILNGVIGHALLVGLAARRFLGRGESPVLAGRWREDGPSSPMQAGGGGMKLTRERGYSLG